LNAVPDRVRGADAQAHAGHDANLKLEHLPQPGDITDQGCEWKLRRAHVEPVVLEPLDNAPPRRTVRPRSMNENNVRQARHSV
jgi:hypothetical protein